MIYNKKFTGIAKHMSFKMSLRKQKRHNYLNKRRKKGNKKQFKNFKEWVHGNS